MPVRRVRLDGLVAALQSLSSVCAESRPPAKRMTEAWLGKIPTR